MDDGIVSVPIFTEAIRLTQEARQLCRKGGLHLHKFISNDRAVVRSVPQSERASEIMNLDLDFDN